MAPYTTVNYFTLCSEEEGKTNEENKTFAKIAYSRKLSTLHGNLFEKTHTQNSRQVNYKMQNVISK